MSVECLLIFRFLIFTIFYSFQSIHFFTFCVKFIPKYLILFDIVVSGIVWFFFLINLFFVGVQFANI